MTETIKTEHEVLVGEGETDTCVLCCKDVEIYSIGDCDHPVCHECSTRMRVLCEQNDCPICRRVLSKVIFTYDKLPYRDLEAKNRSSYYSKKYKISFYCADIQRSFFNLLDHPCPICNIPPFRDFEDLKSHVRKEHDLHYCDICTNNLKIFAFERRCYTQTELGLHRTKGDRDNKSHRGHPLCEFCKTRFLDRDELFRHLRRKHEYCVFCEEDGTNEFYKDHDALAHHFRQDHYLCEEGKCGVKPLTIAFRTEVEYKAHIAKDHGHSLNKHQAKQMRALQLEITLGRHGRGGHSDGITANMRSRGMDEMNTDSADTYVPHPPQQRNVTIDGSNEEDFPSLGGVRGPNVSLPCAPQYMHIRSGKAGLARTKENFPALGTNGGSNDKVQGQNQKAVPISAVLKKAPSVSAAAVTRAQPANTNNTSGMVIHVSNRPPGNAANGAISKNSTTDFPALPMGKSKKNLRALEEDLLPSNAHIPMAQVVAKHRNLIDDYVSVGNNAQKIQIVQKEEKEAKLGKTSGSTNAPKITSSLEFPTLGDGSNKSGTQINSWIKPQYEKKQREQENRKSKVAPAPILPKCTMNNTASKKHMQVGQEQHAKKDKKQKEKKLPTESSGQQPKFIEKNKDKNNQTPENGTNHTNSLSTTLLNGNDDGSAMRPPPGFDKSQTHVQPPPGFHANVTVSSIAKSPNNLTFTSSLGESFSILPSHSYAPPTNSLSRNQKLVEHFKTALQTPTALEEFRLISQKFREGLYKPSAYYEHCQAALKEKFDDVFPELLSLLPDISKQHSLYLVHTQRVSKLPKQQRDALQKLHVCSVCKQVLMSDDFKEHVTRHEHKNQFPALGDGGSSNKKTTTSLRK